MTLNVMWFIGCKPEEKQELENAIRSSTVVLDILTRVIEKEIAQTDISKLEDYDSPSWAFRQADRAGANRVLKNLLKMTKIERPE